MKDEAPQRLVEEGGQLGELLEHAQRGYGRGLDLQRALLRSRIEKPRVPTLTAWVLVLGVAAAATTATLWLRAPVTGDLKVTAEAPTLRSPQPAAPASAPEPRIAEPATAEKAKPAASLPRETEPRRAAAAGPSAIGSATAPADEGNQREQCLTFARQGDPRGAASCFQERASGSGLSAQVALYELSRLQRDALGEPGAALESLTQYLERFPNGSLTGEVRFSRLELLARLGKTNEALAASREFLSSPYGAERAAEVHLFRGNLFLRGAGSASEAVREYRDALSAPGRVGDDAAYQLGVALEASGAPSQAVEAYEQYLARSGGRHRSAASARLAELSK